MESLCIRCKGKGLCKRGFCKILSNFIDNSPKLTKLNFSGSTPPEIFVGRMNYPNVFLGVLSPNQFGNTEIFSMPEEWVKNSLQIEQVLEKRGQMIYSRTRSNVYSKTNSNTYNSQRAFNIPNTRLTSTIQQLAMCSKPTSTEFFLKKKPTLNFTPSKVFSIMANPAPVEKISLEENPKVHAKVDYLVSDSDAKAATALTELYDSKILTSNLQKLLSAGLLGVRTQRKLVPTRWSITAVDDILSKNLLKEIKFYPEITEIQLFNDEYNGNHYEFLLLPDKFSFEVIEAELPGNLWNPSKQISFMHDYESFFGRKTYADSVTGAYYANRLGVCEYLYKIKRQAQVLIFREVRPEYYAPLGVGILRELTRKAFQNHNPELPQTLENAFTLMQTRLKLPVNMFKQASNLLKEYKKQTKISNFF